MNIFQSLVYRICSNSLAPDHIFYIIRPLVIFQYQLSSIQPSTKLALFYPFINVSIFCFYFNTLLSIMDRTTRWKLSKETENLSNIINQLDPADTYRTLYLATIVYTFLNVYGAFSRICWPMN